MKARKAAKAKRIIARSVLLVAVVAVASCTNHRTEHTSYKDAVSKALEQADLKGVTVTEDRDKNTITLGGKLHSDEVKAKAGDVAKSRRLVGWSRMKLVFSQLALSRRLSRAQLISMMALRKTTTRP